MITSRQDRAVRHIFSARCLAFAYRSDVDESSNSLLSSKRHGVFEPLIALEDDTYTNRLIPEATAASRTWRVPSTIVLSSSCERIESHETIEARWIHASHPSIADTRDGVSRMSPTTRSTFKVSILEVRLLGRTRQRTSSP